MYQRRKGFWLRVVRVFFFVLIVPLVVFTLHRIDEAKATTDRISALLAERQSGAEKAMVDRSSYDSNHISALIKSEQVVASRQRQSIFFLNMIIVLLGVPAPMLATAIKKADKAQVSNYSPETRQ